MTDSVPFALYYAGDGYSTARRMTGRQAAGQALLKGIARTWSQALAHGCGTDPRDAQAMLRQLRQSGFDGQLHWSSLPDCQAAAAAGTLYYPAPPAKSLAATRNLGQPAAFSLMGVTHTLSSSGAMDQVADLILPPFKPWDALICTSRASHTLVSRLQEEMREFWREGIGATRFVDVQLPVIPLGVDATAFTPSPSARQVGRAALALRAEQTAFLFAGRLAFHAKANPVPFYQALETLAKERPVTCIEAGVFANEGTRQSYLAAQRSLAPSVHFLCIDGQDPVHYRQAWQAADVFVSLADNIQETFGLTPLEAMAAGLPVVVSDWDGYKDTVRDGIDGVRIPSVLPPVGAGTDLALRYALQVDSYDAYIGRTSMATVVDPRALVETLGWLADNPQQRLCMGAAARARALAEFDWPVILRRYAELTILLGELRQQGRLDRAQVWPQRADPYQRFAHFPSRTLAGHWPVRVRPQALARLNTLMELSLCNYVVDPHLLTRESLTALLATLVRDDNHMVNSVLASTGLATQVGVRALMWLWKFDLVEIRTGT
jgi:glycosyltransferase involved in cell wall biosynthesis